MNANDAASTTETASTALADLFDEELRALDVGPANSQDDQGEVDIRKEAPARRLRELAPYMGGSGRAPESAGHGYEAPHRTSAANLSAEVCYAANADGGMVAIKG